MPHEADGNGTGDSEEEKNKQHKVNRSIANKKTVGQKTRRSQSHGSVLIGIRFGHMSDNPAVYHVHHILCNIGRQIGNPLKMAAD